MEQAADGAVGNCSDHSSGHCTTGTLLKDLCLHLKPPDFPVWFQDSQIRHLQNNCTSWKTYTALCLGETTTIGQKKDASEDISRNVTTQSSLDISSQDVDVNTTSTLHNVSSLYSVTSVPPLQVSTDISTALQDNVTDIRSVHNVTDMYSGNVTESFINVSRSNASGVVKSDDLSYSGKNWIATGVGCSLVALIFIGTFIFYKLYRKYSWKYNLDTQIYIDYNYLHHKAKKKEKWKGGKSTPGKVEAIDIEKSVMFLRNDEEIFISDNHKPGEKPMFGRSPSDNGQIVDLQSQSFGEDPLYVLPSTLPEANIVNCEPSFSVDDFNQDFNLPPLSLSTTGLKGTLETGFINPAYEGIESIIDASSVRKKKKRKFPFLKILRKSKRNK